MPRLVVVAGYMGFTFWISYDKTVFAAMIVDPQSFRVIDEALQKIISHGSRGHIHRPSGLMLASAGIGRGYIGVICTVASHRVVVQNALDLI